MSRAARPNLPVELERGLPTPCMVIDLAACERNIAAMAEYVTARPVSLRPHYKAHKCSRLLALQVEAGGCSGVTCATAWEAEVLAGHGSEDVLVANQVADRANVAALIRAAAATDLTVAADDLRQIEMLARAAAEAEVRVGVLIEVDVGMDRCGLDPGDARLLPLAEAIAAAPALELRGIQAYEGHAVLRPERAERLEHVRRAAEIAAGERDRLLEAGYPCDLISGAGTGTFDLATEAGVLDEIQAGSYVLMDARYATLDLPFENALFCATTVLSRRRPGAAALNAGLKSLTVEYGMPRATTPGVQIEKLADEHAWATLANGVELAVGDTEYLIPAHIDPVLNLHPGLIAWDPRTDALEVWPIDGRRTMTSEEVTA